MVTSNTRSLGVGVAAFTFWHCRWYASSTLGSGLEISITSLFLDPRSSRDGELGRLKKSYNVLLLSLFGRDACSDANATSLKNDIVTFFPLFSPSFSFAEILSKSESPSEFKSEDMKIRCFDPLGDGQKAVSVGIRHAMVERARRKGSWFRVDRRSILNAVERPAQKRARISGRAKEGYFAGVIFFFRFWVTMMMIMSSFNNFLVPSARLKTFVSKRYKDTP